MLRKPFGKFIKDRTGSSTIEFVVTMPLFLAALAFSFEFGQIFLAHQSTVNNVRAAARYLSRSDLSAADMAAAENIVRTGRFAGGTPAEYLTTANATVSIDDEYTTFSDDDFSRNGKTLRIVTRVDFPLTIFGFIGGAGPASIPFVVVEDMRFVGI